MNAMTRDLIKLVECAEKQNSQTDRFRCHFHLMPPTGWLNDPNGLCQYQGRYHAFFQYSPFNVQGGVKMWGHCTSKDLLHWNYEGVALYPDQPFDCHGVYSGSAYVDEGKMILYYTGNVKLDGTDFDYITTGREANTVMVVSEDGVTFGGKKLLMKNGDYPSGLTLHVRDPKVWKEGSVWYMIQGARTKEDKGEIIVFSSGDGEHWEASNVVSTEEPFGYMWECPDYIQVDGENVLCASVQGLCGQEWEDKNVYQSGYFILHGALNGSYTLSEYHLLDHGFDYYAPQSFRTEDGRVIQIAWMGMPDCEEYTNRTVADGWQHCFTFPREIRVKDGHVFQLPVRELKESMQLVQEAKDQIRIQDQKSWEADVEGICQNHFFAVIGKELILSYENGMFEMRFTDPSKEAVSAGRTVRRCRMAQLNNVKILADVSTVEVFINDGEEVFSTRYYPEEQELQITAPQADIRLYEIR